MIRNHIKYDKIFYPNYFCKFAVEWVLWKQCDFVKVDEDDEDPNYHFHGKNELLASITDVSAAITSIIIIFIVIITVITTSFTLFANTISW